MVSYGGVQWVAMVAVETCVWRHSLIAKCFDAVPGLQNSREVWDRELHCCEAVQFAFHSSWHN
jgi:hypothetical protein